MSVATGSFTETIHVRLLDEGTDVWRPVRARRLASGAYELAADPAPADETWEFAPGAHVRVKQRALGDGAARVAIGLVGAPAKTSRAKS